MREITRKELASADSRDGAPTYIACEGLVYDVSDSFQWRQGRHQIQHRAGVDYGVNLRGAPHSAELLQRTPVIGTLVD
jgi:predicted heme/steroid binding protein